MTPDETKGPRVRRARIVATLGPALDDREKLRAAIEAGVDVVRLNLSHGAHHEHARRLRHVREIARELGRNVGCLADLQGPKMRLGALPEGGVDVPPGSEVYLLPGRESLDRYEIDGLSALPVPYEKLADDLHVGALVLIDDGSIRLVVSRIDDGLLRARVVVGGCATSRKGLNLPGVAVSASSLTDKDEADLAAAVDLAADWIALSFVRSPVDIEEARKRIASLGGEAPVVSKLERPEAIEDLEAVIDASDAVMVARGDLGVEIGPERVPAIQKAIIAQANAAGKPVITATEMLETMVASPRPTRAEASDVANAVFDGTDALMLSGETATGDYPVEAIRTMARIIEVAESSPEHVDRLPDWRTVPEVGRVVADAARRVAQDIGAVALAVYSISGASIQRVSKRRPPVPLLGLTPKERTARRTTLMWGTEAVLVPMKGQEHTLIETAEQVLVDGAWAEVGQLIVIVSGLPGAQGATNRIIVHRIGDPVGE